MFNRTMANMGSKRRSTEQNSKGEIKRVEEMLKEKETPGNGEWIFDEGPSDVSDLPGWNSDHEDFVTCDFFPRIQQSQLSEGQST